MAGRPRRTRIYGANYNIGESYYKPALDSLDKKQFGNPIELTKPTRNIDDLLLKSNSIFQKGIHDDEPLYDYIPREPIRKSLPIFDDEPEEEFRSSVRRFNDLKKATPAFLDDFTAIKKASTSFTDDFASIKKATPSFTDDFTAIKERNRNSLEISRFPKAKPILDFDDFTSDLGTTKADIFKSTTTATSASSRANATKERLANIEYEMSERMDKQVQREKRSANLKKLLTETGIETTNKTVKKVTF